MSDDIRLMTTEVNRPYNAASSVVVAVADILLADRFGGSRLARTRHSVYYCTRIERWLRIKGTIAENQQNTSVAVEKRGTQLNSSRSVAVPLQH